MMGHKPFTLLAGPSAGESACEIDLERWPCEFTRRGEQLAALTARLAAAEADCARLRGALEAAYRLVICPRHVAAFDQRCWRCTVEESLREAIRAVEALPMEGGTPHQGAPEGQGGARA